MPGRTPSPLRATSRTSSAGPSLTRKPGDRKTAITAEAARLFADRGFAAIGMDDIGAAVGITGPAIYRHFRGKDAVLAAVMVDLLEDFVARADAVAGLVPRAAPDLDPLSQLVEVSVAVALGNPAPVATYIRERGRLSGEARRTVGGLERQLRTMWERVLRAESPDMVDDRIVLRQQAVLGAMGSMTLQRNGVPRPRLDALLTAGSLRMLRAPVPSTKGDRGRPGEAGLGSQWQPQISRREAILNAALTLMRAKGYHGVGIDEIGDAAGISGPAVYRHYASKADILLDAYDRVGSRVAVGVEAALAGAKGPDDALARLIDSYVTIALDNVDLIIATGQEGASLPAAERPRLVRQQRAIAESWCRVVAELRPDLSDTEVRRHVGSVFPMVNHVAQLSPRRAGRQGQGKTPRAPELRTLVRAFLVADPG